MFIDVDGHSTLERVIKEVDKTDYKLAISNRCFETWLNMHQEKWEAKSCQTCKPPKSSECKSCFNVLYSGQFKNALKNLEKAVKNAKSVENSDTLKKQIPPFPGSRIFKFIESLNIFKAG